MNMKHKGLVMAAAAAIVAIVFGVWLLNRGTHADREPWEQAASSDVPASTASINASEMSIGSNDEPPKLSAADVEKLYPDRYYLDHKHIQFDHAAYEIVLTGTPGDEIGDWQGEVYASALKWYEAERSWKEFWSSGTIEAEREPPEDTMIGGMYTLQPAGSKVALVVFDTLPSGSWGMNTIHALTIDDQGRVQMQVGVVDAEQVVDIGLIAEQSEDMIVTDSWDGGQVRLSIEDNQFVFIRKPRSEVYPEGAIPVPIQNDRDGGFKVVGEAIRTMKAGEVFVFAPVDELTKERFDAGYAIYTDPSLGNFSLHRHSYDRLIEPGIKQYYLSGYGEPSLTIEVAAPRVSKMTMHPLERQDAKQIADRSLYHDSIRGIDGTHYDFYLYDEDEANAETPEPWSETNAHDKIYAGDYLAAVGRNGILNEYGPVSLSYNQSLGTIADKLSSADDYPDVLYISQSGMSGGNIVAFYIIGDGELIPLTLRYDDQRALPELFVTFLRSSEVPGQYETNTYDIGAREWVNHVWQLDEDRRELVHVSQTRSELLGGG